MDKIKDAIAQVKKDVGISSDDNTIGSRYIYQLLKNTTQELLRQEVEKKGIWTNMPMQTLRQFELERIDFAEVDEFKAGITVYKSVKKFPTLLDTKKGKIIGGVYLPTGKRLDVTDFNYILNSFQRRYTADVPLATFRDDSLYIFRFKSDTPTLFTMIDGIYENPEEVETLNAGECEEGCIYYPDLPFFIPGYLKGRLFRIVKTDLAYTLGIPLDNTNDGKSDVQQGNKVQVPQP